MPNLTILLSVIIRGLFFSKDFNKLLISLRVPPPNIRFWY